MYILASYTLLAVEDKETKMKNTIISTLLLYSFTSYAQTYFVTDNGNTQADGLSWETSIPFQTASTKGVPGDTFIVRRGDYKAFEYKSHYSPVIGGTEAAPITIKAEDGTVFVNRSAGWALIDQPYINIENIGCKGNGGACVTIKNTHHVNISGMVAIDNWRGVNMENADDSIIENSYMTGNQEGIYLWGGSDRNIIRNNHVTRNGNLPWDSGDRCGLCVGGINAGVDNKIIGNEVSYNGGLDTDFALPIYNAERTEVIENHVHHNYRGGMYLGQYSYDSLAMGNRVEYNGLLCNEVGATNISGLSIRNGNDRTVVANNKVLNNCVANGNDWGDTSPRCGMDVIGIPTTDIVFVGNTVEGTVNGDDFCIGSNIPTENIKVY